MFTIDLLKGEGIPIKSKPEGIAIGVIALVVPVIVVITAIGAYLSNSVNMSVQKDQLVVLNRQIAELQDAMELRKSLEREKDAIVEGLAEVKSTIGRHIQWTPILVSLVENMPQSLVLTKLQVQERSVKREVPKKDNPDETVTISVPVRMLKMNIQGDSHLDCDRDIREFCDNLRYSKEIKPRPQKVEISDVDVLEDKKLVSYEIDCIFESSL